MLRKCLTAVVLAGFVSVSFWGCGSDDEESSVGAVTSEMTAKKSETSKKQNKTSVPKTKQEREQSIRFDVSGIEVSKDEMDRLIPYARKKKLKEDDVRYVVALLKLCGVDFRRVTVKEDGQITLHSLPGEIDLAYDLWMQGKENSSGKYCVDRIDVVFSGESGGHRIKLNNGVRLDIMGEAGLNILYLQEINKIMDDMFFKPETLEHIPIETVKVVKNETLSTPVVEPSYTLTASGQFDKQTNKVVFQNKIFVHVAFEAKSEVYGAPPEKKTKTVSFDFAGNVLKE